MGQISGITAIVRRTLRLHPFRPRGERDLSTARQWPVDATWIACAVALLWVVHPLQTQAVTYLSQRTEVLMGLCYLLTLHCFIRGAESGPAFAASGSAVSPASPRTKSTRGARTSPALPTAPSSRGYVWLILSVLSCLLGAASKEVIATAPVIMLLYDRTFVAGTFREAVRRRGWYYLALALSWVMLTALMRGLGQRGAGLGLGGSAFDYALTECWSVVLYLKLAFWPHPLVFEYGLDVIKCPIAAAPYALVLAPLVAGTLVALRCRPALDFAAD